MRTGNYGVSCVMTGEIGEDIAVIPIAMVYVADNALFALPMPMDMAIEMESGITVLLASMCKSGSDQKNAVQRNA
jgi:hypothetical protein